MIQTDKGNLYSTAEAAAYLGVARATLTYHIYDMKHLAADGNFNGDLTFLQATLDRFKEAYQSEAMTAKEVAASLNVSLAWVKHQIYVAKTLTPDAKRGTSFVFKRETVEALRPLAQFKRRQKRAE